MTRKRVLPVICGLWSVVFIFCGCGYTTRSGIASKYQTIYVTPFVNKIDITQEGDAAAKYKLYRPQIETDVTKRVTDRFLFDGNLKPVPEGNADVVLKGEVTAFRKEPVRYEANNEDVAEYRISIVINMNLWNRKDDKLEWEENGFSGEWSYFTSGSQSIPESQAVNDALDDLARRVVERAVEQW